MNNRTSSRVVFAILVVIILSAPPARAQNGPGNGNPASSPAQGTAQGTTQGPVQKPAPVQGTAQPAFQRPAPTQSATQPTFQKPAPAQVSSHGPVASQDLFRQQMLILIKAIRDAKTDADRKAAEAKIRQFQEQWAADHPAKELPAAEQAERDRKMKEQLKNDPDGWQLYQLEQSMRSAKTTDERKSIMAQMADLHKKIQADQEAKMTPQEKAARKPQEEKLAKMRAELAPLIKSMGEATTDAEKIAIRAQMDAVTQKYGVGPRASGPDTPKNPGK